MIKKRKEVHILGEIRYCVGDDRFPLARSREPRCSHLVQSKSPQNAGAVALNKISVKEMS